MDNFTETATAVGTSEINRYLRLGWKIISAEVVDHTPIPRAGGVTQPKKEYGFYALMGRPSDVVAAPEQQEAVASQPPVPEPEPEPDPEPEPEEPKPQAVPTPVPAPTPVAASLPPEPAAAPVRQSRPTVQAQPVGFNTQVDLEKSGMETIGIRT